MNSFDPKGTQRMEQSTFTNLLFEIMTDVQYSLSGLVCKSLRAGPFTQNSQGGLSVTWQIVPISQ